MNEWRDELARRMAGAQRHRLLQGYPSLPLMQRAVDDASQARLRADGAMASGRMRTARRPTTREGVGVRDPAWLALDPTRPLIVGVLPHAQCNPKVEACGFCTFPHDRYHKGELRRSVHAVAEQMMSFFREHPEFVERRVDAVYFGGATANLTPPAELAELGRALALHVDLQHAEVTLEGVPNLFQSLLRGPFEVLLEMPARHRRISMGVQTFDAALLMRMGRQHFGTPRDVERVIQKAHRNALTVSGDFLINLPAASRDGMLADLSRAADLGFDQICVYHLVLVPGHGTPWAEDAAILAALPAVEQACDNWLAARAALLERGYVQTTLTNFERSGVHATAQRFVYEEHSFTPERYDALGFGPLSVSTFSDFGRRRALKFARGKNLEDGLWGASDLLFRYDDPDLRLLFLTRTLARLGVPRATYRELFDTDLSADFGAAVDAVVAAGLATLDAEALRLTPEGMFYADSVVGVFTWQRVDALRATAAGRRTRDALRERLQLGDHMG